jgi:hypothetical protein
LKTVRRTFTSRKFDDLENSGPPDSIR